MNITKYQRPAVIAWPSFSPFTSLSDELDRLFEAPLAALARNTWSPTLDVLEDKDNYFILAELPGLKREDIQVSLEDGTLTISGERKSETRSEDTLCASRGAIQRTLRAIHHIARDSFSGEGESHLHGRRSHAHAAQDRTGKAKAD